MLLLCAIHLYLHIQVQVVVVYKAIVLFICLKVVAPEIGPQLIPSHVHNEKCPLKSNRIIYKRRTKVKNCIFIFPQC